MACVIDASCVVAAFVPDEAAIDLAAFERLVLDGLVVPAHWPLEIANAFRTGIRRGRFPEAIWPITVKALSQLVIEVEAFHPDVAWTSSFALSGRHGLTLYDAAYLELAMRRNLPLATLDSKLAIAARDAGAAIVPLGNL